MNFNKAVIVGNLTRDPEVRTLPSGQSVVSFSVATNRIWNDASGNRQEATEFHNVVAFGKLADICSRYLSKGRLVLVEGRIQTRSWQDQNGNRRYRTEIIADNMQMGPKSDLATSRETSHQPEKPDIAQEEIPVIDSEEPITQSETEQKDTPLTEPETQDEQEQKEEEVDVKNIPF